MVIVAMVGIGAGALTAPSASTAAPAPRPATMTRVAPAESGPGVVPLSPSAVQPAALPCSVPTSPYAGAKFDTLIAGNGIGLRRYKVPGRENLYVTGARVVGTHSVIAGPIFNGPVTHNQTVMNRFKGSAHAISAVNGDFFYLGRSKSAWGPEIARSGELRKGTSAGQDAIVSYTNGAAALAQISVTTRLFNRLHSVNANSFNTESLPVNGIAVFTPEWGNVRRTYIDPSQQVLEIIVAHNVIQAMHTGITLTQVPSDGMVIEAQGTGIDRMHTLNLKVGNQLNRQMMYHSSIGRGIKSTIGVGLVLIRNKQPQANAACVSDRRVARAMIGVGDYGRMIYTVVCEGITDGGVPTGSAGLSLREATGVMRSLGVTDAMMFDGGGSATMTMRNQTGVHQLTTSPDGWNRSVPNLWGFWAK